MNNSSNRTTPSGWFTRDLRVAEGQEELYLEFEQAWRTEIQPQGLLELEAFADFVRASWHKREVVAAQNEAIASSPSAFSNGDAEFARQLDRLHRYERDFERRAAAHLRELRRLQSERALRAASQNEANYPPPPMAKPVPQKRSQSGRGVPPAGIPESVLCTLYTMQIETDHWNAQCRAIKAGILATPSTPK